jgi:hypothetical protein
METAATTTVLVVGYCLSGFAMRSEIEVRWLGCKCAAMLP